MKRKALFLMLWMPATLASTITVPLRLPYKPSTPVWSFEEVQCLTRTVYGEARGEPFEGQVAVARVVVNRSHHPHWPQDLCEVVQEPNQFKGYWVEPDTGSRAWETARHAAQQALYYRGDSLFFATVDSRSKFHAKLVRTKTVGRHHFYRGKS